MFATILSPTVFLMLFGLVAVLFCIISPIDQLYAVFLSLLFSLFWLPLHFSSHLCLLSGEIHLCSAASVEPFPRPSLSVLSRNRMGSSFLCKT